MRYKQAAVERNTKRLQGNNEDEKHFLQWMADNVDHNQITLTGKDTFHGMGVLSVTSHGHFGDEVIKRTKEKKGFRVCCWKRNPRQSSAWPFEAKISTNETSSNGISHPIEVELNLLRQCSWFFRASNSNWSGIMHSVTQNFSTKKKNLISFLPIMDFNPSDEKCIHSTLLFVCHQARKLNIFISSITFDQPLWLSATGIIEEAKFDNVCL